MVSWLTSPPFVGFVKSLCPIWKVFCASLLALLYNMNLYLTEVEGYGEMHGWFVITVICWIIVNGSSGCFLAAIDAYTMPRWAKLLFLWYALSFSFSFFFFFVFLFC